jgi:hypothetical protein
LNSDTLLLRQIHPSFVQEGRVTSQAFRPTPKDEDQLSVYNGDSINARNSWEHYTATLNLASDGVMALTKAECDAEALNIVEDAVPFPEHCSIDFSGLTDPEQKKKSKKLAAHAKKREWLFYAKNVVT